MTDRKTVLDRARLPERITGTGEFRRRVFEHVYWDVRRDAPVALTAPVLAPATSWGISNSFAITPGTYSGAVTSITYTLERDGTPITGAINVSKATAEAYAMVAADIGPDITVVETAAGPGGNDTQESAAIAWAPDDIGSVAHWYRGDQAVLVSTKLSSWTDLVGDQDLAQGVAADRPASATLGGQAAFDFSASAEWVTKTLTAALSQPWSVLAVAKADTTVGTRVVAMEAGGGGYLLYLDSGDINGWAGAELDGPVPTLGNELYAFVANNTAGELYVNDVATPVATGASGTNAADIISVGASASGLFPWDGLIAELVYVAGAVSAADRVLFGAYVNNRYGMSVALS